MPIRLGKKCLSKDTKEMSTLKFFLVCVYVLSPSWICIMGMCNNFSIHAL
mgnify:CR=1 FL=1